MKDYSLDYRKYVIGGVATVIVVVYIVRLFTLQLMSDDYKKNADSNAFMKKVDFPSRGVITDRNGELLVYNQPSYDVMVVMNEAKDHIDTLDFCQSLGITRREFDERMARVKNTRGYSRFTQQMFMSQLSEQDFSIFQEKLFRFPGFYVQRRSIRQYEYPYAAHVLGDVAEVSPADIENDDYYQPGDYIGKLGVERSYERQLRGEKGVQILLRDAHGRIQGSYQNGALDMADAWYQLGEKQEGDRIADALANKAVEYITWYLSLSDYQLAITQDNCEYHLALLDRIVKSLKAYESPLASNYEDKLDELYEIYVNRIEP